MEGVIEAYSKIEGLEIRVFDIRGVYNGKNVPKNYILEMQPLDSQCSFHYLMEKASEMLKITDRLPIHPQKIEVKYIYGKYIRMTFA